MTPLQVFIAYAKIRRIIPYIHKIAITHDRTFYNFDQQTGQYTKKYMSFKNVFDSHFSSYGFSNSLFTNLLYQYPNGDVMFRRPCVEKAHKRWMTFVNNNVIFDGNLKIGSKVRYRWWNIEYTGVICSVNKDLSAIRIRRDCDRPVLDVMHPGSIIEVDGQPPEFSFHIKWRGKEYGNK